MCVSGMHVPRFLSSEDEQIKENRPKGKELLLKQEKKVKRMIMDKQPEQLKLPFGLWTRSNVAELIYEPYGIRRLNISEQTLPVVSDETLPPVSEQSKRPTNTVLADSYRTPKSWLTPGNAEAGVPGYG
jgi:hypothetical protein